MKISKYILPTIIALSALSVSVSAAFYSVSGLSKLFAGASLEVIIMAGSLEASKLVLATLLHQYWKELNKFLKVYLSGALVILVLITSMGIYGFLSAAYQETASKAGIIDTQIEFLQQKANFFQEDVDRYDREIERISSTIQTLSQTQSREIQVRDTSSATGFRNTISTTDVRLAQERIRVEEQNRRDIQLQRTSVADSLQKYQVLILEANVGNDLAAELGPLKYLSGLTGWSMDRIVNILLLTIIFVFDPLAVSLVIAANFAFDRVKTKPVEEKIQKPKIDTKPEEPKTKEPKKVPLTLPKRDYKEVPGLFDEDKVEEKTFSEKYTGEEEEQVGIKKVVQKTPSHIHAIMEDGSRQKIKKKDLDDKKIRYL